MTDQSGAGAGATASLALLYGRDYFEHYGFPESPGYSRENCLQSFGTWADRIVAELNPRRVLDVGCAKGFLVESLRERGVEAYGLDISEYAISQVRPDIKPYCWVGSGGDPITDDYDLITCVEVCEHLPESEAVEAIREMTSHSNVILFSSTPGLFEDPTHVNVRPTIDWLRLFAERSFEPNEAFDTTFVTPWAILLRRASQPPPDETLRRYAYSRTRGYVMWELSNSPEIRTELDEIKNSKAWKLISLYRKLRGLVRRPTGA